MSNRKRASDSADASPVSRILHGWRAGDEGAVEELVPLVYGELRRLAASQMRSERGNHTLQPTALVHEAYARLVNVDIPWRDRGHFFAVAARTMRRILVDHARAKGSEKRGGGLVHVEFEDPLVDLAASDQPLASGIEELDEALESLAARDERKARVLELHYFAGLTHQQIADVLEVSLATVDRDLRMGRAWLRRALSET